MINDEDKAFRVDGLKIKFKLVKNEFFHNFVTVGKVYESEHVFAGSASRNIIGFNFIDDNGHHRTTCYVKNGNVSCAYGFAWERVE